MSRDNKKQPKKHVQVQKVDLKVARTRANKLKRLKRHCQHNVADGQAFEALVSITDGKPGPRGRRKYRWTSKEGRAISANLQEARYHYRERIQ